MQKNTPYPAPGQNQSQDPGSDFPELHAPLTARQALIESERCLYCSDAPCVTACPTHIDVPGFIAFIAQQNINSAARSIYRQNILGGSCARVCPTEILCEQSCVLSHDALPVKIGLLQRYATDHANFSKHPVQRSAPTGRKIAVIGAGPAGLSCAHQLAMLGNEVEIFEAETKPGGLNEYGIARYKMADNFAQREVEFVMGIGGIQIHYDQKLGTAIHLNNLLEQFDAVFLGTGSGTSKNLNITHEDSPGMVAALGYIKVLRQAEDLRQLPVPRHCLILGGGNTAIDMAVQIKLLGAEQVSIVYRRGIADMPATAYELELAKSNQVRIVTWAQPVKILLSQNGQVSGMQFEKTELVQNTLQGTGSYFELPAEAIYKAIGQSLESATYSDAMASQLRMHNGKVWVDAQFQTSVPRVYAGGDCNMQGQDLTVVAVQHGKLAARAIHQELQHG